MAMDTNVDINMGMGMDIYTRTRARTDMSMDTVMEKDMDMDTNTDIEKDKFKPYRYGTCCWGERCGGECVVAAAATTTNKEEDVGNVDEQCRNITRHMKRSNTLATLYLHITFSSSSFILILLVWCWG